MRPSNHRILGISTIFIKNEKAVLGLPMRLTVSLIIGTVALVAILSYVMNPCLFPDRMIVSVNPMVNIVSGNNSTDINITIYVNETNGYPIKNANVIIKGLTGIGANHTDENGKTIIQLTVKLESGVSEGYLDVSAKSADHETFSQQDMIKILRH